MATVNPALYCSSCNILCSSPVALRSHLGSKKHQRRLNSGGDIHAGTLVYCSTCNRQVPGGETGWQQHVQGRLHRANASIDPTHSELPFTTQVALAPPGQQRCTHCLVFVPHSLWESHLQQQRHQYKVRLSAFRASVQEDEQDKFGATVSHQERIDLGTLEVDNVSTHPALSMTVTVTATNQAIRLLGARFASASIPRATQHFKTGVIQPQSLTIGRTLPIHVTFEHNGLRGRFQDRIEFLFEDASLSKEFTISRLVHAVVGVQAELDALKPIAPYVRAGRGQRAPEREIVQGERPPALNAIPWKIKLEDYLLPKQIENAIRFGNDAGCIARIQDMLPTHLTSASYGKHWSFLLFAEEAQMKKDLEIYDMVGVPLVGNGVYFYLDVPGLAEKRPSVLVGDTMKVRVQGSAPDDRWFEGYVHVVRQRDVGLRFASSFNSRKGQLCDVHFELGRFPLRRMHQAMDRPFTFDRVLFPTLEHIRGISKPTTQRLQDVRQLLVNQLITTNVPQLLAVTAIKDATPGSLPFVIWGPPGTGKTITMVEAIRQILQANPEARILACAPSNSAADLIAERLQDLTPSRLFRLVAPSRAKDLVNYKLLPFCVLKEVSQKDMTREVFSVPPLAIMRRYKVIVSTCVQSSVPHGVGFPRGHFTHIFIDEAGQGLEPEVMIPIKTMAGPNTNIILSGDPKQLGPILHSDVAKALGLGQSYLERLLGLDTYDQDRHRGTSVVKLVKNYRSHPSILRFPNAQFYRGELQAFGSLERINRLAQWRGLPKKGFPIIFHALKGEDMREASSPSFFNPDEASTVKYYVKTLRDDRSLRLTDSDIGVISPYNAQCRKIRKLLDGEHEGIKVDSTEGYQGQERPVIIISTVRSRPELVPFDTRYALGFVAQPRRLNVAITRAQALLVVIGDPAVLGRDGLWRMFLSYVYLGGGWIGDGPEWDPRDPGEGFEGGSMEELQSRLREMALAGDEEERDEAQADRPWWREE